MDIGQWQGFFGWCTVVNIAVLVFSTVFLAFGRGLAVGIHAKLFDIDEERLSEAYFRYLANFKIAVLVFNLVPWVALKIMS